MKGVDCKYNVYYQFWIYIFKFGYLLYDILYMKKGVRILRVYTSKRKRSPRDKKFGRRGTTWSNPYHTQHRSEGLWINPKSVIRDIRDLDMERKLFITTEYSIEKRSHCGV
jgi:hypothetical protein